MFFEAYTHKHNLLRPHRGKYYNSRLLLKCPENWRRLHLLSDANFQFGERSWNHYFTHDRHYLNGLKKEKKSLIKFFSPLDDRVTD